MFKPFYAQGLAEKVPRLTKILSWNMTKSGQFFNMAPFVVYTILRLVWQYLDPFGLKNDGTVT